MHKAHGSAYRGSAEGFLQHLCHCRCKFQHGLCDPQFGAVEGSFSIKSRATPHLLAEQTVDFLSQKL